MERKREIEIQKNEAGLELLTWISKRYTYHTLEEWRDLIVRGRVKINGEETASETVIKQSDIVSYFPDPVEEPPVNSDVKTVYEDDNLLVISKPADIPCHPGGIYFKNTLWYLLKDRYEYFSLVNRLDRETSGIMLVAKNRESAKFYFNVMMRREITKEYLVLVHGSLKEKIDAKGWIRKASDSKIRKKREFLPDSEASPPKDIISPPDDKQFAHTILEPLKEDKGFTLVKCNLITGRTHQIRATLSSLGYPVVGDKIYGLNEDYFFRFINDELTTEEWESLVLENQALHSWKTTLPLYEGGTKTLEADPPANWPVTL